LHSLVVHSSRIQASLGRVFEGYPVPYETDRELILSPPFTPFVHRWAKRDEPDAETKKNLHLLGSLEPAGCGLSPTGSACRRDRHRRIRRLAVHLNALQPPPAVDKDGIQELAEHPLNGRQIKSVIKTAAVLANSQGSPVMLRHLRVVLNLRVKGVKLLKRDSTPPSF
jgi:hypothetical protein